MLYSYVYYVVLLSGQEEQPNLKIIMTKETFKRVNKKKNTLWNLHMLRVQIGKQRGKGRYVHNGHEE